MNYHLVILKKPYLDAILTGRKTIESRFYKTRQFWLSRVAPGDILFLKESSGPVRATAIVDKLKVFDSLTSDKIAELKQQYNQRILGDDSYWREKSNSQFGIIVWLKDVKAITPRFIKKADWRAWVVLTKTESFGLVDA
jgi:ASC-1-like (ASCH) protein